MSAQVVGGLPARRQAKFEVATCLQGFNLHGPLISADESTVNAELMRKALEKVGNPNVLVNLVSRRVRQLNSGGGGLGRPLVHAPPHMGVADIAMLEIVEDKITAEPALDEIEAETSRKRRRRTTGPTGAVLTGGVSSVSQ